jgi:hypothetical protein
VAPATTRTLLTAWESSQCAVDRQWRQRAHLHAESDRCGSSRSPLLSMANRRTTIQLAHREHLDFQNVIRTPANASNGAAGLWNRLSTPGPLVTAVGGIPGGADPGRIAEEAPGRVLAVEKVVDRSEDFDFSRKLI